MSQYGATSRASPWGIVTLPFSLVSRPDVETLQQRLYAKSKLELRPDGVYGPFTDKLVSRWQKEQRIHEKGVGEDTRKSLGL